MIKLLVGASILCIAMVLLGVKRGFDISDEGLYVLLADPHQQNVAGILNYDLFFKFIFRITGYSFSLVELRIFRLISYLAGAWALAGFWGNITGELKFRPEIFWISCIGLFAGYAFLPPTLSYNSLTVVLVCFWLMLVSEKVISIFNLSCLGILFAILVYVKISIALIFFPLTFLNLLFLKKIKPQKVTALILPIILLELVFLILFEQNAITRLSQGIPLNSQRSGYQFGFMLESMAVGGFWIAISGFLFFAIGYLKRTGNRLFNLALPVAVFGILAVSYLTHITEEWNHLFLISSAGLMGFYLGRNGFSSGSPKIWIGILLLLPFLLHFGSNVYWLRIGIHYWVFWILAFLLFQSKLKRNFIFAVSSVSILLVFNGIWWHPFGQDNPLWEEKMPWPVSESEVVYLEPALVPILNMLQEFGLGKKQERILAAYRIPGLAWLSGFQIPNSPGIWEKSQLDAFFEIKPEMMIYNNLQTLPPDWTFSGHQQLGVFQGDTLQLLWD